MTYVIGAPCIDVTDRACVDECPVDCIYIGGRSAYINPDECIDCSACEPVCPAEAIFQADDALDDELPFIEDNARFFKDVLPGQAAPVGNPGGAADLGDVGVDTPLVAGMPAR